jgi:hypothetical protein
MGVAERSIFKILIAFFMSIGILVKIYFNI